MIIINTKNKKQDKNNKEFILIRDKIFYRLKVVINVS
jgi:hypothetical protein